MPSECDNVPGAIASPEAERHDIQYPKDCHLYLIYQHSINPSANFPLTIPTKRIKLHLKFEKASQTGHRQIRPGSAGAGLKGVDHI